jgi:2-keto-4-pentenoate hydratase/2-oxohepta-3-ene-1,7-dioic acid hydratase in catechol pathway
VRVARVEYEGTTRTAIVGSDATSVRLLELGITTIDALRSEHPTAPPAAEPIPLDQVRLRAPVDPRTIRDFSVFEQHMEGARKNFDPDATVPEVFYATPFCYFSNPHAITGPGDEIAIPPGVTTSTSSSRWPR